MLSQEILTYRDQIVAWRRDFHAHPELGFQEVRTSKIVQQALTSFGLEVQTDFCSAKTAVIGILRTGRVGRTIALRADMDALPMQDEKDVDYRSQTQGVCHACGHDGHTACLLAIAKYCASHAQEFCGTIKFVFQPAEEGPAPGGASCIMASDALQDVEFMIGGHQGTYISTGQVLVCYGNACAGGDTFKVTLHGKGTHAVSPQDGNDVIVTAAQIIEAWQSLVTRRTDPQQPAVVSVCSIHAGQQGTTNVLPASAEFCGTVRTLDDALRQRLVVWMKETAQSISALNGCTCEMEVETQFPVLKNNNFVTDILKEQAQAVVGANNVFVSPQPSMGSEDFAHYARKIPSSYFLYGVRNDEKGITYGGHHPKFDLDEDALLVAVEVMLKTAKALVELPKE